MRRLIVVASHPSLHLGFSTVGDQIANSLQKTGRWEVEYIGRYSSDIPPPQRPYRLFNPLPRPDVDEGDDIATVVERRTSEFRRGQPPTALLSVGTSHQLWYLLDELDRRDLRKRVRVFAYVPLDSAPAPPPLAPLLGRVDVLVPFTQFARRVAMQLCAGRNQPCIAEPIPHGVDTAVFVPPDESARAEVRRRVFGIDDDTMLLAFFGRNTGHKHPELALRIFAMFCRGDYHQCRACARVTPFVLDPIHCSSHPLGRCRQCGSRDVADGLPQPRARLYLHTDLLPLPLRRHFGGWDLELLADRLRIADQVIFDRTLSTGRGVPVGELAQRMGACDVHLLPYDCGGWELTVLETGACGVPNVITDIAGPPEYARPFSEVIPPVIHIFSREGKRGMMDIGKAIAALVRLGSDRGYRQRLGQHGIEVARAHSWDRVAEAWDALLGRDV